MNARQWLRRVRWMPRALWRRGFGSVAAVATDERVAALTFDDGPHPEHTPRMLEVLARHRAMATFFMLGRNAAAHPEVVAQVAAAGHAIGNHTHDHVRMPETPRWERLRQLRACGRAVAPFGARLFRPPFGGQSWGSRFDVLLSGRQVIVWNVQVDDWNCDDRAVLAGRLAGGLRPGAIILLHDDIADPRSDSTIDRGPLIGALDDFLGRYGGEYEFLTVPELLRRGRPVRWYWFRPAM